jgi:hypothetical protein
MSEVISIEQIKKLAHPAIDIPGYSPGETIKVRVRKPQMMKLMAEGQIPNHLLSVVEQMMYGSQSQKNAKKKDSVEGKLKDVANVYEVYCRACLVEPTYEEFEPYLSDDQKEAIFNWATAEVAQLENFREDQKDGASDNDEPEVQSEAKPGS